MQSPPPNHVLSAWGLPQNTLIFRWHFQSILSATSCPYLATSCRFESQNDPQSHPKSLQNWSPKPSLLQSADVLDNPLFTIRKGPQATLHQLQKPSKIGSNCNSSWYCSSRPQKTQFLFQMLPTWPQRGSNLGPTWPHFEVVWGPKLVKDRP